MIPHLITFVALVVSLALPTPQAPPCAVKITHPEKDATVGSREEVRGEISGPVRSNLWLLVKRTGEVNWQVVNKSPLPISQRVWRVNDVTFGSSGQSGRQFEISVRVVDVTISNNLADAAKKDLHVTLPKSLCEATTIVFRRKE